MALYKDQEEINPLKNPKKETEKGKNKKASSLVVAAFILSLLMMAVLDTSSGMSKNLVNSNRRLKKSRLLG